MAELTGRDQDRVQQLLDLRVASFGLVEHFADEVDRSLHFVCMPSLLALDDDGRTDNPGHCSNVDQECFAGLWYGHNWRRS
jgi:hypothetical protein